MPWDEPAETIQDARAAYFAGDQGILFGHIGTFVCWFSLVELQITFLLAHALEMMNEIDRFEFLVKGMDARVKINRFLDCDPAYVTIGDNLRDRLDRFERISVPIRNQIAHSTPHVDGNYIHFGSAGARPVTKSIPQGPVKKVAPKISLDNMVRESMWLHWLSMDLRDALRPPRTFEITSPQSNLPKAGRPGSLVQEPRAKRRKRRKTPSA